MLSPSGYKLYSLAFGSMYVRTFLIHDVRGVIANYVLGECGATESPFPADFFTEVSTADNGLKLTNEDQTCQFSVTSDKVLYLQRTASSSTRIEEAEIANVRARAEHLITGAMQFLQEPNLMYLGMFWDYVRESTKERERYKHPAAEALAKRVLKVDFDDSREYPAEVSTRVAFRRRLQESAVQQGRNDYINAILHIRDEKLSSLWDKEAKASDAQCDELPRVAALSIDVQRFFDPRRRLDKQMFDTHWKYCS